MIKAGMRRSAVPCRHIWRSVGLGMSINSECSECPGSGSTHRSVTGDVFLRQEPDEEEENEEDDGNGKDDGDDGGGDDGYSE